MTNQLEDKEAIRELFSAYCFRMDDGDYAGVGALFAADGEWIATYSRATGPDEIAAMLGRNIPDSASGTKRKHFVMNSLITCHGDTATARASYFVVIGEGAGPIPVVAGTYEDELVRSDAGWVFRSRRLVHDIAGSLGLNSGVGAR
jgi:hypothetical protein